MATPPGVVTGITTAALDALAAGQIAAVRVPDLLGARALGTGLAALDSVRFATYDPARVFPPVARLGVSVNDHRRDRRILDSYWPAVREAQREWEALGCEPDMFRACRDVIGAAWPAGIEVGSRGGRRYSQGIVREIDDGLQVHFDDATLEHAEDLFDRPLIGQLAFNLYLRVPDAGGELMIWRNRRLQPADEAYRIPGYGYDERTVAGLEPLVLTPRADEAILFDPRNFHTVRPAGAGGRRVALAFSIGIAEGGRLLVWS